MKKITILLLLASCFSSVWGQGLKITSAQNPGKLFYVGSLPETSSSVYQKLKIEVFGGNYHYTNVGEVVYYVSTRDRNVIKQEVRGGTSGSYSLRVFKSSGGYDFAIEITNFYTAIWLRSWLLDGTINGPQVMQPFAISEYDPSGKTDVTAQFPVNVLMATSQSGNIGIGTISPDYKLDVIGTIRAHQVLVNTQKGADFVFEDGYALRPLEEVEQFISENKHLPDIPSAQAMAQQGVDMGELQVQLLQKIEELTLYVIELKKENSILKQEMEAMKKRQGNQYNPTKTSAI